MDSEKFDNILALLSATAAIALFWYIGIFELFDLFLPEWFKYGFGVIGFLITYQQGKNIRASMRADRKVAYEREKDSNSPKNSSSSSQSKGSDKVPPLPILKDKLEENKITKEEFEKKKEALEE